MGHLCHRLPLQRRKKTSLLISSVCSSSPCFKMPHLYLCVLHFQFSQNCEFWAVLLFSGPLLVHWTWTFSCLHSDWQSGFDPYLSQLSVSLMFSVLNKLLNFTIELLNPFFKAFLAHKMRQLYHISVHHSACGECKINSAKIWKTEQKLTMNNLLTIKKVHDLLSQVLSISTHWACGNKHDLSYWNGSLLWSWKLVHGVIDHINSTTLNSFLKIICMLIWFSQKQVPDLYSLQ